MLAFDENEILGAAMITKFHSFQVIVGSSSPFSCLYSEQHTKRENPSSLLAPVWRLLVAFVLNEYFIPVGILKMLFGD